MRRNPQTTAHHFRKPENWPASWRQLIAVILFTVIFLILFSRISDVLQNKSSRENISTFYEEPPHTVDVIFAGTSHPLFAFSPMEMWNSHGIVSYNIAQGGQMLPITYYCVEEALRLQSPKVVVLDLYYSIKNKKYGNIERAHSTLDNMAWSPVKFKAILDTAPPASWGELFFPIIPYHTRWMELTTRDFTPSTNAQRGCGQSYNIVPVPDPEITSASFTGTMGEASRAYLQKIIDLCREKEVPLVFTVVPYSVGNDNDPMSAEEQLAIYNQGFALAEEYGIPCVNYFDLLDEIGFDFETDMFDSTHMNVLGARKVSHYMAEWLTSHYPLEDRREDPAYARWHEDYETYLEDGLSVKSDRLSKIKNLTGYFRMLAGEEDYLVLLNLGGGDTDGLSDKAVDAMAGCGLKTDLREAAGKSYAAVIEGGAVVYEETSSRKIQYTGQYIGKEVQLFSNRSGTYFHTIVDGKKVGANGQGLNITVYSRSTGKLLDSVVFQIGNDSCTAKRKKS